MAVRVIGFSTQGPTAVTDALTLLISRQSEKLIQQHKEAIMISLIVSSRDWQDTVREKLSEPVQGSYASRTYVRNTSLWPRMQQGRLVDDILRPEVTSTYASRENTIRKNNIRYTVTNFYGPRIVTIGNLLNSMQEEDGGGSKPFAGWLNRAAREWEKLIQLRLLRT